MYEQEGRRNPLAAATVLEPAEIRSEEFERIFRDHHALVFRAAYRVTGNHSDAEDVLQTVFLRLLRRNPDAEGIEDVVSYLYRASVNCALDLVRSTQNARSIPLKEVAPLAAVDPASAPDTAHSAAELRRWLRETLARLSPRAAEIFVLRFFEEKANPEIARILGTTEGTVAVTLSRTRDRIQQELQSYLRGKS
jgi:RNA polymerase sigma-70 factor (ECF subfamily)